MNATFWEIGALVKTMGMKTDVTLDPTLITTRVKNSIKRQLRAGAITLGWASQAAKIAEQLAVKFDLPVARHMQRGVRVGSVPMSTKVRLLGALNADWAVMLLDRPEYAKAPFYQRRRAEDLDNLTSAESKGFYLSFFDRMFTQQAQQVMNELLTEADFARIELAIAVLDSNEPIHITTFQ